MNLLDFILLLLATLYLAEVLTSKAGPFNVFARLRTKTTLGGLLTCIWCSIVYVGAVFALIYFFVWKPFVYPFALAGGALALRSYSGVGHGD